MKRVLLGLVLASPVHATPRDFTGETRAVYAVAACGDTAPSNHDATTVEAHCKTLAKNVARWRSEWLAKAAPWFTRVLGRSPSTVVYPFGGGDAITMLAVYPDATEYTTLSLEGIGDPRPLATIANTNLARELRDVRAMLDANLDSAWNTTAQLSNVSSAGTGIPGILASVLLALEIHGYEPLATRYFELGLDGSPTYLTQQAIDAWDAAKPAPRRKAAQALQRGAFNNIEIEFRKKGDPKSPTRTFRHIAADLSDAGLTAHAGAARYLDARKDVAALIKGAAYLLWRPDFAKVRGLLLANMKVMVSDDTGIPPRYAKPAGFTQHVYGAYSGAYFRKARGNVDRELVALWRSPVEATLPFRFGYYDSRRRSHLMITRR